MRERSWHVTGSDHRETATAEALELGAIDAVGVDPEAEITFVATPVGEAGDAVTLALEATTGLVTDVGSVKSRVARLHDDPRFVPGHPMAGSEQAGVGGASDTMFFGAVWVLTPTETTSDDAFARVRAIVSDLGAEVVSLTPEHHDELVAMVSHVPHLTAAALMRLASERAIEQRAMLRLAAGGFRDMTRIAAGHPGIWPDICAENRTAIVSVLDDLIASLTDVRRQVDGRDGAALAKGLADAREARVHLPTRGVRPEVLTEVRVPIPDKQGELARVATLAGELDVNVYDIEIAHTSEGDRGVLILVVETEYAERLLGALVATGYRPRLRPLS